LPEKIKELEDKTAENFLHLANQSKDAGERSYYTSNPLRFYPSSPSAQKIVAQERAEGKSLDSLGEDVWIGKAFLENDPVFYGPRGLNLEEKLFAGDPANRELAGKEVAFLSSGKLKVAYHIAAGFQEEEYELGEDIWARFSALLWEVNYLERGKSWIMAWSGCWLAMGKKDAES